MKDIFKKKISEKKLPFDKKGSSSIEKAPGKPNPLREKAKKEGKFGKKVDPKDKLADKDKNDTSNPSLIKKANNPNINPNTGEKIVTPPAAKVKVDFKPILESELMYIFDNDLSDINEYEDIVLETTEELSMLSEVLSINSRIQRRNIMRRNRSRIRLGRMRALRRRATQGRITNRARRSAISTMKKRFSGRRPLNQLSFADRARVERMVARRKGSVERLTRRNVRIKRQQERDRFNRRNLRNSFEMQGAPIEETVDFINRGLKIRQTGVIKSDLAIVRVLSKYSVTPDQLVSMYSTFGKHVDEGIDAVEAERVIKMYNKKYSK